MAQPAGSTEEEIAKVADEIEDDPNYKVPVKKSMNEILNLDQEDESLKRYKETLLGNSDQIEIFPDDKRFVIPQKLALVVEGRPDIELDLTGNLKELKKKPFVVKEGVSYRLKIYFYVQREIVQGLKYRQKTYNKGIRVDSTKFMVGSYGPKKELQFYQTPLDEAPSGMLARTTYSISSVFCDDDGHSYLEWDWAFQIKKDWTD